MPAIHEDKGFDYPKITTSGGVYLKIDDVVETVDESEEIKADKKAQENLIVPNIQLNQNYVEQGKPTKPQKQKQVFDASGIAADDCLHWNIMTALFKSLLHPEC